VHIDPTTLFLVWFGGGFVVFLVWAALVGQALMGERPEAVRPAVGVLALIGIVHPAAALGAVDLVRLSRTLAAPPTEDAAVPLDAEARRARAEALALPPWAVGTVYGCAVASFAIAAAAFVGAGGFS
jgi:hypothetical protein